MIRLLRPVLVAVGVGLSVGAGAAAQSASQSHERFLVIPFENTGKEARLHWLGEASAVLLADGVNAHGRRAYTR